VWRGESEVIGSWKIMAIRPPRRSRMASLSAPSAAMSIGGSRVSGSSNVIEPPLIRATLGRIRRMACAVTDLPDPDSPTRARVRPLRMSSDKPSTARKPPASVPKSIESCLIDRSGASIPLSGSSPSDT
jgi:hypothetical protein